MVSRNKKFIYNVAGKPSGKMWETVERCEHNNKTGFIRIQFNECDEPYDFIATGEFFKSTITIFCS
jgi:hypothetical protein